MAIASARAASMRGREAIGRLVDQIAREILRFGDDAAVLDGVREIAVLSGGIKTGE